MHEKTHVEIIDGRCGVKTRKGTSCPNPIVTGGKRCRMHGGHAQLTNAGALNGRWRGGTSKDPYAASPVLGPEYVDALNDPDFIQRNSDVALLTTLILRALDQLDANADATATRTAFDRFAADLRAGDQLSIRVSVSALRDAVHGHADNERLVRRIERLVRSKTRALDSLRRYYLSKHLVLSRAEALRLGNMLLEAIVRNINDPNTLEKIRSEFQAALGRDGGALMPWRWTGRVLLDATERPHGLKAEHRPACR